MPHDLKRQCQLCACFLYSLYIGTSPNPSGLYVETCRVLIQECGVTLETPDVEHGRTAAHWATYYHRDDILAELIIAGT